MHVIGIWVSYATLRFRSEIPKSVSWSPDSSLIAVAVGPYVTLYDPSTKLLRSSLTFPEGHSIQGVHFIGHLGRHLLASTARSLIMWDLVIGRGIILPIFSSAIANNINILSFMAGRCTSPNWQGGPPSS